MRDSKKYWLIQSLGWGLFALLNIYISFLSESINASNIIINILLAMSGVLITHLFRKYMHQQKWHTLETTELLFRVLIACIPLAFFMCVFHFLYVNIFLPNIEHVLSFAYLVKPFIAAYIILLAWSFIYFSWSYIEKSRSQMIVNLQTQNELKDLELKSMRANLQPHFIFNSLNSIRALVNEDPSAAREAVTKLSKILRSSISTKENSITLAKECALVKDYLHLEQIRFEERLTYHFAIDRLTEADLIPPMLLQNMVENAVKHGISVLEYGGSINIKSTASHKTTTIEIKNEGTLAIENKMEGTGFGMHSSKKRLHHLYPNSSIRIYEDANHVIVEIKYTKE